MTFILKRILKKDINVNIPNKLMKFFLNFSTLNLRLTEKVNDDHRKSTKCILSLLNLNHKFSICNLTVTAFKCR